MGQFFNFSIMDLWNNPTMKVLRTGTKLAVKGIASASAKAEIEEISPAEFRELLEKARGGNSAAQCDLGLYYAQNEYFEEAEIWLKKSAKQGNEQAREILEMMGE